MLFYCRPTQTQDLRCDQCKTVSSGHTRLAAVQSQWSPAGRHTALQPRSDAREWAYSSWFNRRRFHGYRTVSWSPQSINQSTKFVVSFDRDDTTHRLDKIFKIHVVVEPEGRRLTLSLPGSATIQELKTNVYYVTNTPVRHQEWSGWPSGCDNDTILAVSFNLQISITITGLTSCQCLLAIRHRAQPRFCIAHHCESSAKQFQLVK